MRRLLRRLGALFHPAGRQDAGRPTRRVLLHLEGLEQRWVPTLVHPSFLVAVPPHEVAGAAALVRQSAEPHAPLPSVSLRHATDLPAGFHVPLELPPALTHYVGLPPVKHSTIDSPGRHRAGQDGDWQGLQGTQSQPAASRPTAPGHPVHPPAPPPVHHPGGGGRGSPTGPQWATNGDLISQLIRKWENGLPPPRSARG